MSQALPHDESPVYDLVGIGFGPSNLALAIAVTEHNAQADTATGVHTGLGGAAGGACAGPAGAADPAGSGRSTSAVFLERQPRFGWHRGMLIDDATMQVSFLKDLVTLRNPASEFSFLSYLHGKGRLLDFINHKTLFPLRVEFHDYLEWAAGKVDELVRYDHEVVAVEPVHGPEAADDPAADRPVEYFDVLVRTPDGPDVYRARNLVIATGLRPHLPPGITLSDRVWHNRDLLSHVERLGPVDPRRFVVVGAGQSAAEVTAYLHRRFPDAEVCGVFARYGYSPADDSAFANRIFDPDAVDEFFAAPSEAKQLLLGYHNNTNYSVVDIDLIDDLYRRVYAEKVAGARRLRLFNVSRLAETAETPTGVRTTIESLTTGERTELDADVLVFATGYRPADPLDLLGEVGRYCHRDEQGRLRVARDYRAETGPALQGGIYLQGCTEHSHGITSSLLSNIAVRVDEILQSVLRSPAPPDTPAPHPEYVTSGTA